jgi:hypothetical protein
MVELQASYADYRYSYSSKPLPPPITIAEPSGEPPISPEELKEGLAEDGVLRKRVYG